MNLLLASSFQMFGDKIDIIPDINLESQKVLCIITASLAEPTADWLEPELLPIKKRSKQFDTYDIGGKSPETLKSDFENYDVIYVSGGNTYFLLEKAKKSGFEGVIREKLKQGCTYLGSSAGAVLACPRIDFIEDMDDKSAANLSDYKGLSLIDFLVLPHLDNRYFKEQAHIISEKLSFGSEKAIGLRDDQAIYLQDNYIEIF